MADISNILGQAASVADFLSTVTFEKVYYSTAFTAGLFILLCWLIRNKWLTAVEFMPARLNKMRLYVPLLQLYLWMMLVYVTVYLIKKRFEDPTSIQAQLTLSIARCAIDLGMIFSILVIVFMNFHGRFNGFGLNIKTLGKDLGWGWVNYLGVMPVVLGLAFAVNYAGRLIVGPDFEFPKHDSLKLLVELQFGYQIIIILSTTVVVPIFEELLFRGLMQTAFRTRAKNPWIAIILTSMVFAITHSNWQHWLPLMAFSICLGYAYEKSGSILRPICIHVIFNAVSIAGTLMGSN